MGLNLEPRVHCFRSRRSSLVQSAKDPNAQKLLVLISSNRKGTSYRLELWRVLNRSFIRKKIDIFFKIMENTSVS